MSRFLPKPPKQKRPDVRNRGSHPPFRTSDTEAVAGAATFRYHLLVRQNSTGGLKTMTALGPDDAGLRQGSDIAFVMKDHEGREGIFAGTIVQVDRERLHSE